MRGVRLLWRYGPFLIESGAVAGGGGVGLKRRKPIVCGLASMEAGGGGMAQVELYL